MSPFSLDVDAHGSIVSIIPYLYIYTQWSLFTVLTDLPIQVKQFSIQVFGLYRSYLILNQNQNSKHSNRACEVDDSPARQLSANVRILCWVMTQPINHKTCARVRAPS